MKGVLSSGKQLNALMEHSRVLTGRYIEDCQLDQLNVKIKMLRYAQMNKERLNKLDNKGDS